MKTVIVLIVLNLLFIAKFAGEESSLDPDRSIATFVKSKDL